MRIMACCRGPACTATPDETLQTAAQRMEKEGVGLLAVEEDERVVGVLTDRDVALHFADAGRDAPLAAIGELMSHPPLSVGARESVEDALARMARSHVRRLLVMDGDRTVGVVSADDLLLRLSREIDGLGDVLVAQLPAGSTSGTPAGAAPEGAGGAEARPRGLRSLRRLRRDVVTLPVDAPVAGVARAMREHVVGSIVLLRADGQAAGIVTDRDLALRVAAPGRDPETTSAAAVMSEPLIAARPDEPLDAVVARMRTHGVRRIPIVDAGRPVGLVSFDDLLAGFARELGQLADCTTGEIRNARIRSYPARMRHELEERIEDVTSRLRVAGEETWRTLGRELEQVAQRVGGVWRGPAARPGASRLRVRDLMRSDVRTCTPEDALSEPARIMWERDCGCVPVVAADGSGRVVGMITDRDLCMAAYTSHERLSEVQVKSAMSERVYACHPDDTLAEASAILRATQVRRLPVVDEAGHLRGILSLADLAEAAAGQRVPAGMVSAAEVGLALEAICRPRSQLVPR